MRAVHFTGLRRRLLPLLPLPSSSCRQRLFLITDASISCPSRLPTRCGTAGLNTKPRPDLDLRTESVLNETERLQTPYDWLIRPACRDQVRAGVGWRLWCSAVGKATWGRGSGLSSG